MYIYYNANPLGKNTGDCVIRAISTITGLSWHDVFLDLAELANINCQMMDDNDIWHEYLVQLGFKNKPINWPCAQIRQFQQGLRGDPQQMVQQLRQNGQMSDQQFNYFSGIANQIMPFMRR